MITSNEKLISTIKELIKERLQEDPILLDSPRKRRGPRLAEQKRRKRGK